MKDNKELLALIRTIMAAILDIDLTDEELEPKIVIQTVLETLKPYLSEDSDEDEED
jgi:hypothetical protein